MEAQKIVDFLSAKIKSYRTVFPNSRAEYVDREMKAARAELSGRKNGDFKNYPPVTPAEAVDRISWILNGSYGAGASFIAWTWIINNLAGKRGKNVDRAWISIGRELTIYSAFLDSSECTVNKICDIWKKQNIDFKAVNEIAAVEVKRWISAEMGEK